MQFPFMNTWVYSYLLLPLIILLARIVDVSLGTIRIISVSRGRKFLAPVLGFFEILIWLFVITQIFNNLTNIFTYLGYAAGFAAGNFIGILIEEKLGIGYSAIRIIGSRCMKGMMENLQKTGYGVTSLKGQGTKGPVQIIFMMIKRKDIGKIVGVVRRVDPRAFYTIEDARVSSQGVFPREKVPSGKMTKYLFRFIRPGK